MATRKKSEATPGGDNARVGQPGAAVAGSAAPSPGETAARAQMQALEQGVRLFREQRFAEAKEFFSRAAAGPQASVSLAARNHISVCDRRTQKPALALQSAEDHYNYGVERLNARDLDAARKHMEIALALRPGSDYMLYGLAAAQALSGDVSGAYENLRRAIEVDPRNRATARHDPDFAGVVHNALFAQLFQTSKQPF